MRKVEIVERDGQYYCQYISGYEPLVNEFITSEIGPFDDYYEALYDWKYSEEIREEEKKLKR